MGVHVVKHYGVKGMHWGQHKQALDVAKTAGEAAKLKANKTKAVYKQQTAEAGGLHKLSNKELEAMLKRMEMEKKYSNFMNEESKRRGEGLKATVKILGSVGKIGIPIIIGLIGAKKAAPTIIRTVSQYQRSLGS